MGGNDVPEQHLVGEAQLREHAVHDRRRRLRRPPAGQLPLGRERDAPRRARRGSPAPRRPGGAVPPPARRDRRPGARAGAQPPRRAGRSSVVCPMRAATSRSMSERIEIRTLTDGGQQPPADRPRRGGLSRRRAAHARRVPVRLQPRSGDGGDRRRRVSPCRRRVVSRRVSPTTSITDSRSRCRRHRSPTHS